MNTENISKIFKRECKLCSNIISDEHFETIDDIIKDIFQVLLMKLKFDHETQYVMCRDCYTKLYAALNFKLMCLSIDKTPTHSELDKPSLVDLKDIYVKDEEVEQLSDGERMCRVCRQSINDEYKSIQDVPFGAINIYFPEINFEVTGSPELCEKCLESLCLHSSFIKSCLDVDEKLYKNDSIRTVLLPYSHIKTEEIEIKCEESNKEEEEKQRDSDTPIHSLTFKTDAPHERGLKLQKMPKSGKIHIYTCRTCKCQFQSWSQFSMHRLKHKAPLDLHMLKCDQCEYKTIQRINLKNHQLRHKDPSEVQMHECNECDYITKNKSSLKRHQLLHKDPSEVQTFKCDKCEYRCIRMYHLKSHALTHRDSSELKIYKCNECQYETKKKSDLKRHTLNHMDVSDLQMYKCDKCGYRSIHRHNLKIHALTHRDSSELQIYKCSQCQYETKSKFALKRHSLKHRNASEVEMYKCDDFEYQSKHKSDLASHRLTHKDPSEVQSSSATNASFGPDGDTTSNYMR